MAFTDAEMAVLSQLAYYGSKPDKQRQPSKGDTLYSVLTDKSVKKYLENQLGDDYDVVLQGLIDKTEGKDYKIVKSVDDNKGTGFAAIAIKDPENNVTVATRGTEGFDVFGSDASRRDVAADLELAFSISTSQQEEMEKFMRNLEKEGYEGYYFTGHSLGGNLANYGAITLDPVSKVKGVVTFNAPGFNEAFISKYAAEINAIYNRVNNYQNEYDYVSSIMFVPGPVTIIESSKSEDGWFDFDDHLGFDDHSLNTLKVEGDGFSTKKNQVKSVQTHIAHGAIEWLRDITGLKAYTMFLGVVEIGINLGRTVVMALNAISEWFSKNSNSGYKVASADPTIRVDTAKLRGYAERLGKVNQRLITLDGRMDDLYFKVGLRDLFNLIQADLLTGSSWRITNCEKYLDETANDFEGTERNVVGQFQG